MKIRRLKLFEELESEIGNINFGNKYPFFEICYFETFCKNFCNIVDIYILGIYDDDILIACGFFEKISDEKVVFLGMKPVLGKEEVTDFGDIVWKLETGNEEQEMVKGTWESILKYFKDEGIKVLQLDYVREDSPSYGYFLENNIGEIEKSYFVKTSWDRQETSPYIDLSKIENWEGFLMSIERIKRKELRRKIRRLEEKEFRYEIISEITEKDFEDFVSLHRLSDSQKEKFMSERMKAFFYDIVFCKRSNWGIKLAFLVIDKIRVASLLYFENNEQILLYNSGFNPEYQYYSVGIMLVSYILNKTIEDKKKVYDFLRGDERYKYDLGAKDLWLYKIMINLKYTALP